MTIDELKARKRELMARKKYELELQERGEGDNMALFMVNEELLDVNAQLRALAPAGKRPKFGRRGRTVHASYGDRARPWSAIGSSSLIGHGRMLMRMRRRRGSRFERCCAANWNLSPGDSGRCCLCTQRACA